MLSALQHYVFCPRQCGLIHVEGIWNENALTARGRVMHERVDSGEDETRGTNRIVRSLNIYSRRYGLTGKADVVEFKDEKGLMRPYPVEYKSGKPKLDESDTVQLCAQALCLEEMTGVDVPEAAMYYGKTRHRLKVTIDEKLRSLTRTIIEAVHDMVEQRKVPDAAYMKKCRSCSLHDYCMPETGERKIQNYIRGLYKTDEEAPEHPVHNLS